MLPGHFDPLEQTHNSATLHKTSCPTRNVQCNNLSAACLTNVHKRCQKNVANNCGINARQLADILNDMGMTPDQLSKSSKQGSAAARAAMRDNTRVRKEGGNSICLVSTSKVHTIVTQTTYVSVLKSDKIVV